MIIIYFFNEYTPHLSINEKLEEIISQRLALAVGDIFKYQYVFCDIYTSHLPIIHWNYVWQLVIVKQFIYDKH